MLERETSDVERRAASDRKRVTTKSDNRYLKHMSLFSHHVSTFDLKVSVESECGVNLSA